jgi:hypothetical protein
MQGEPSDADDPATMRTLGFRTHVLMVLAGAFGVLAALGRPWYAPPPAAGPSNTDLFEVHGPLRGAVEAAQRWVTDAHGATGWEALGSWGTVLGVLAVVAAAAAAGSLLPALQCAMREPLKYSAFGVLAIAAWRVVDTPGPNTALELRVGALVALVAGGMMFVCAQGVAAAPLRRRATPPAYTPPPRPPVWEAH